MEIVFFSHPSFLGSQSMPRFTRMLAEGMKQRGHNIEIWSPQPRVYRLPIPLRMRKWFGYVDQYIIFPLEVRSRLKHCSADTLFVFTDHALGPWVPLVADRHHVIHCHDFLAQLSAIGKIKENPTSWTGRQYQAFIRRGYSQGKNFISVSTKTREDLHKFVNQSNIYSKVVYNGLNSDFHPCDLNEAKRILSKETRLDLSCGYILHVGGNEWYKNREGVIEIYNSWRENSRFMLPLLMIGNIPSEHLQSVCSKSPFKCDIHWLSGMNDQLVHLAYSGATALLFPSLAEGFGWPIAEAMASGCPVITTDEAPMTEVAGDAGIFIPRRPNNRKSMPQWASKAADVLDRVISLPCEKRKLIVDAGLKNVQRFNTETAINKIEKVYQSIVSTHEETITKPLKDKV